MQVTLNSIGTVHSPYTTTATMPIQGTFKPDVQACVILEPRYKQALKDLEGFSHAILIYYFHKAESEQLITKPFLEDVPHGVFATRSPNRPNHLGLSTVKIAGITANRLYFTEVDILDQTPILDIKPYVKYFDARENTRHGWLDKHFRKGPPTERTILK